ncbi:MAG: galactose mutarotase [Mogibacterium sp.]|nr:galactose mutarotase [Mogibacterium sp.]
MRVFDQLPDGREVTGVALRTGGIRCEVITYGAALRTLEVPDRAGHFRDVVLGFDEIKGYLEHAGHFGGTIGRFANRIGGGRFSLNGVTYELPINDGENHLHGGPEGFDRQIWEVASRSEESVTMRLFSPDGQAGYPGSMEVSVTYTLFEEGGRCGIRISYEAVSDRDTVCNLTNHSYFNLNGHGAGRVEDQYICVRADAFTPVVSGAIPTGEIRPVRGTPMDLRKPVRIGEHISDDYEQLLLTGGYDHNYVLNGSDAAEAFSAESGIRLTVHTDQPGVQFYAGNFIGEGLRGKGGAVYGDRHGFCLETQNYPDAPNRPEFPSAVLRAGERYRTWTEYRFDLR